MSFFKEGVGEEYPQNDFKENLKRNPCNFIADEKRERAQGLYLTFDLSATTLE